MFTHYIDGMFDAPLPASQDDCRIGLRRVSGRRAPKGERKQDKAHYVS
jgi:hypothetical protein